MVFQNFTYTAKLLCYFVVSYFHAIFNNPFNYQRSDPAFSRLSQWLWLGFTALFTSQRVNIESRGASALRFSRERTKGWPLTRWNSGSKNTALCIASTTTFLVRELSLTLRWNAQQSQWQEILDEMKKETREEIQDEVENKEFEKRKEEEDIKKKEKGGG